MWAYYLAHVFSLLRLPFALVLYLGKLAIYFRLGKSFSGFWSKQFIQFLRTLGDFINFFVVALLFYEVYELTSLSVTKFLVIFCVLAEVVRLVTEKGIMVCSAFWQIIPHRSIAKRLSAKKQINVLRNYCKYYVLSDEERLVVALRRLRAKARLLKKIQTSLKLRYVSSFQIVPDSIDLRAGNVRNVAEGVVYVHASWTNNPDILCGQALRRSPWIFDPRYLRRPFYYRTEANRLMTLFVFENARLCPLFAIYQFGHEIKSARYNMFFRTVRWFGYELEEKVRADGIYNFDPFAKTILHNRLSVNTNASRALWTDDEVIADVAGKPIPYALEIAEKYTYPLVYIQEVLLPKILAYRNTS